MHCNVLGCKWKINWLLTVVSRSLVPLGLSGSFKPYIFKSPDPRKVFPIILPVIFWSGWIGRLKYTIGEDENLKTHVSMQKIYHTLLIYWYIFAQSRAGTELCFGTLWDSFKEPAVTGSVTFCPTWLGAREVWPVSLISAVEEATLIFRAAPLPQPAKVTLARMSQPHEPTPSPPSHSTSSFSPLQQSARHLSNSATIQFLFAVYSHLPSIWLPSHSLVHRSRIIFLFLYFFVRLSRESLVATGGKRKLTENPPLTSILASPLTFLLAPEENFKELQKRRGSGRLVNIRGHQPGLKQDHSVCKGWWDFFLLPAAGHTVQQPWFPSQRSGRISGLNWEILFKKEHNECSNFH